MNSCLYPECSKIVKRRTKAGSIVMSRGLCWNHYRAAYYLVRKGITTWAILEQNKKCLPKTKSWFIS